jgi:hypothetical protein
MELDTQRSAHGIGLCTPVQAVPAAWRSIATTVRRLSARA